MTDDDAAWRDDRKLPLSELGPAMATYSADGQVDDETGGDASATKSEVDRPPAADTRSSAGEPVGDPDPDSEEGRRLRPSPEGHAGPV